VVFRAVVFKLLVWCGAEGYVSGLQDAAASCKPDRGAAVECDWSADFQLKHCS